MLWRRTIYLKRGITNNQEKKPEDEDFKRGITEPKINKERINEHKGSTHCQPKFWINKVLAITKTEPSVSAKTWRKTP